MWENKRENRYIKIKIKKLKKKIETLTKTFKEYF